MENNKFDKLLEKETETLDKIIVRNLSNLEHYQKENIKEFDKPTEIVDYLKSLALENEKKILIHQFALKVHFSDLEDIFEKNVASSSLPKRILAIVIPQKDINIRSFLISNSFGKSSVEHHDLKFDGKEVIVVMQKQVKELSKKQKETWINK